MRKKIYYFLILTVLFAACEKSSDSVVNTPRVAIDCDTTACQGAAPGGSCGGNIIAIVILTNSGCADPRYGQIATGSTTVTCNVSGCMGTVSQWTNANGIPITEIAGGQTDICGLIDLNCDTKADSGEPIQEKSEYVSSSLTIQLDDWTDN